jgi:hypothetical protein
MATNNVESTGKITAAFTTYSATGNREDLSNAIYNIDPFDTPVMSASRRRNVKNRTFDWQTEYLPVVDPANAQFEGFQLINSPATPTIRLNNVTQISKRDATVSGTQEEVDAAGKGSEMAHQMAMSSKVLKSDMEVIMCSRQARSTEPGTDPFVRLTESISHWLGRAADRNGFTGITGSAGASGPVVGVIGATGTITTTATGSGLPATAQAQMAPPATAVQITEAMLGLGMQQAYVAGASPTLWIVPPGVKRTVSTFTGRSSSQVLVGKTEVVSTIDVIATDFGRVKVAPSRWVPTDIGLLIDPDYLAVAFFRSFRQYLMARIGDAETRLIVVEWGVEMRNPMAHLLFNGIKP